MAAGAAAYLAHLEVESKSSCAVCEVSLVVGTLFFGGQTTVKFPSGRRSEQVEDMIHESNDTTWRI